MSMRLTLLTLFWLICPLLIAEETGSTVPPAFEQPGAGRTTTQPTQESEPTANTDLTETYDAFDLDVTAPKIVQVQVDYIQITQKQATELLLKEQPKSFNATALRMKLQDMADKEQAKVLHTQMVVGRSGEKATRESIAEIIYPTEYASPNTEKEPTAIMATTFDVRNTGSNLEIEPVLGENSKMVDIRFVPELIWHNGNTVWQEIKNASGQTTRIQMPDFYTIRLNTAVTCISGQYSLVSTLNPSNSQGKIDIDQCILVFLKCDVLPVVP